MRAQKTKTAVISFRSLGLSPQRNATATSQPEEHGTHHRADNRRAQLVRPDQRFSDDDAGQSPHHHSDSHADVRESLILRQQRSGQRHEAVRNRHSEDDHVGVVDAQRPDHLHVVAGGAHGHTEVGAQKKIQQRARQRYHQSDRASTDASRTLTSQPARSKVVAPRMSFTPICSDCVASVVTDSRGTLLLPMMCRLME